MEVKHVPEKGVAKVMLYALSTCGWCQKVKGFLDRLGVEYHYIYVDLLEREERLPVLKEVQRWNPDRTFPTLVINDEECIVGYDEDRMKKSLNTLKERHSYGNTGYR